MLVSWWRNWNHLLVENGKQYGCSSKNFNTDLSYGPAISLLGIDPNELRACSQKQICTPMFETTLLTLLGAETLIMNKTSLSALRSFLSGEEAGNWQVTMETYDERWGGEEAI